MASKGKLTRSSTDKVVAGVCGGLAEARLGCYSCTTCLCACINL